VRAGRRPLTEGLEITIPLIRSALRPRGAPLKQRIQAVANIMGMVLRSARDHKVQPDDPIKITREKLATDPLRLHALESAILDEIDFVVELALEPELWGEVT
jgi:hypothetical protein